MTVKIVKEAQTGFFFGQIRNINKGLEGSLGLRVA